MKNLIEWVAMDEGTSIADAEGGLKHLFKQAIEKPTHNITQENCHLCRLEYIFINYAKYYKKEIERKQNGKWENE